MDFETPKPRWKPKVNKSKKGPRPKQTPASCLCKGCRDGPSGPSRGSAKNALNKTLEREYRFPVRTRARPDASAIVNWFFEDEAVEEDYEHEEEHVEEQGEDCANESLVKAVGAEDYEALLREHMEVESALKRVEPMIVPDSEVEAPLMTRRTSIATSITDGWEVVSEAGTEGEGWEQVAVE
jgi:hypothetical protein